MLYSPKGFVSCFFYLHHTKRQNHVRLIFSNRFKMIVRLFCVSHCLEISFTQWFHIYLMAKREKFNLIPVQFHLAHFPGNTNRLSNFGSSIIWKWNFENLITGSHITYLIFLYTSTSTSSWQCVVCK